MKMRGDVCSFGLTDALRLLGAQIAPEAHTPRRGDQGGAGKNRHGWDPHIPQAREPTTLSRENDGTYRGQYDADPQTYQASPSTAGSHIPDQPSAPLGIVELLSLIHI